MGVNEGGNYPVDQAPPIIIKLVALDISIESIKL